MKNGTLHNSTITIYVWYNI